MREFAARRTLGFTESVIREMTRLCMLYQGSEALNLAQGFPDFPAPEPVKEAACQAIREEVNQYSITWGARDLREAIAVKVARWRGIQADPETMVTVTCGATEAMIATLLALLDPGDEVVVFQPFYENYGPDTILSGAVPRFVTLHEPDWHVDPDELAAAFGPRTKAIVINTPNNPTGKVFTRQELRLIAGLCQRWDCLAVTDEIYEHLVYNGEHVSLATLTQAGFRCFAPDGAYYVMADISAFGYPNDLEFAHHLVRDVGFAVVPGSSFYRGEGLGSQRVRFCFAKKMETLQKVEQLLSKIEPYEGH